MVVVCDVFFEGKSCERADKRHKELKAAKEKGHSQDVFDVQLLGGAAAYDSDCEGVHCQADGDYYYCD